MFVFSDAVGSLGYISPLSISLAASEGLSEIRNLAFVVQSNNGAGNFSTFNPDYNQPTSLVGSHLQIDNDIAGAIGMVTIGRPPLPPNQSDDTATVNPGPSQRL